MSNPFEMKSAVSRFAFTVWPFSYSKPLVLIARDSTEATKLYFSITGSRSISNSDCWVETATRGLFKSGQDYMEVQS